MAAIAACALALTVIQHGMTVGFGFYYDDYHFLHPYSAAEIAAAFHGPWDQAGIETAYYRPLTICLYAARFAWLGLNSEACHALSLVLFATMAAAFGLFAARAANSLAAGLLTTATLIVHPGMPYAAVAWVTNQMHLAELLVVIAALNWWLTVRRRGFAWWLPLIVLQVVALMIKEDGVMLLPAIVALHTLRKYLVERDLPHVPVAFAVIGVAAIGALLLFRASVLQGAAHTRLPSFDQARYNVWRGLWSVFALVPARRPYQWTTSWFVLIVPVAAVALWWRIPKPTRFVMLAGLVVSVLFVLPFVFILKAEQLHIVSAGAALFLAGAATGLVQGARSSPWRGSVLAVLAAGLVMMAAVTRHIERDFEPFSPNVLATDVHPQGWAAVPVELRDYLAAKRTADRGGFEPNPARALRIVTFGAHGPETDARGTRFRWMSQRVAEIHVTRDARLVALPVRHEIGAFRDPAVVRVIANGRRVHELTLTDGDWHLVHVALKAREASRLRGMHVLRLEIDRTWVPARVLPGSTDTRTLGIQVGIIDVR